MLIKNGIPFETTGGFFNGIPELLNPLLQVATPVANPIGGTYDGAQSVALTCSTPGASIYYTTNGNIPTTNDTKYTTPIDVLESLSLKAIGVKDNYLNSKVMTEDYTINTGAELLSHTVSGNNSAGTTTAPIDTTGADLIIIFMGYYNYYVPTDSEGNAWTALTAQILPNKGIFFYCLNPNTSATHTFTINGSSCYASISVAAFSGLSSFDLENGEALNSTSSLQPGSVTPTNDNALIITGLSCSGTPTDLAIDSGFTISDELASGPSAYFSNALAYKIQTTKNAENPQWTWTSTNDACCPIAVFY